MKGLPLAKMKPAILLLFAAALTVVSVATPYRHKFKHIRVQEGVLPISKYTDQWICEIREQLIARVREACSNLPSDRFEIKLHLPRWFCDELDDPYIQQQLRWKCGFFSEARAMVSAMDQHQGEHASSVLTSICNAIFAGNTFGIEPSTACPVIKTLTAISIRARCLNVARLPQTLLEQHLGHLQQICRTAISAKNSVNIQWDKGMDFPCKFYKSSGFVRYLEQLCRNNMPNYNIPNATLEKICDEEHRGNLVEYLNKTCSERRLDTMPARIQQEGPTIPVEHTSICTVLAKQDMATAIDMVNNLCDRVDGHERPTMNTMTDGERPTMNMMTDGERVVPPGEDRRMMEVHWGLCVDKAPLDRLEMLCSAIEKGYLVCPSTNIPALCRR